MSINDTIDKQICPEWIMKSKSILGRCVPSITEDELIDSTIDENVVTWEKLTDGVTNLAKLLGLREVGAKVFSDLKNQWWTILVGLIIASVVSFLWIILMR